MFNANKIYEIPKSKSVKEYNLFFLDFSIKGINKKFGPETSVSEPNLLSWSLDQLSGVHRGIEFSQFWAGIAK